jgi:hypothetical protein
MHDPRLEEPLSDAALDREIEQLVGVDPPAGFAARVRTRVAAESAPMSAAWRLRWAFVTAGVFVGLSAVTWYVRLLPNEAHVSSPVSDVRLSAIEASSRPSVDGWREESGGATSRGPAVRVSATGRGPKAIEPIAVAATPIDLAEVVLSADEVKALRALIAMSSSTRADVVKTDDVAESTSPLQTAAIVIPPIEIEPLELIARLEGDGE